MDVVFTKVIEFFGNKYVKGALGVLSILGTGAELILSSSENKEKEDRIAMLESRINALEGKHED